MNKLHFDNLIASQHTRERDLIVAMVTAWILQLESKLATTCWWYTTTLPEECGVANATEDDLYQTMDWLVKRCGNTVSYCWISLCDHALFTSIWASSHMEIT